MCRCADWAVVWCAPIWYDDGVCLFVFCSSNSFTVVGAWSVSHNIALTVASNIESISIGGLTGAGGNAQLTVTHTTANIDTASLAVVVTSGGVGFASGAGITLVSTRIFPGPGSLFTSAVCTFGAGVTGVTSSGYVACGVALAYRSARSSDYCDVYCVCLHIQKQHPMWFYLDLWHIW